MHAIDITGINQGRRPMTPRASTGMCEFGSPDLFDGDDDQKRSEQHG